MRQLTSIRDFNLLRDRLQKQDEDGAVTIVIPAGTCGLASGAGRLIDAAQRAILAHRLAGRVRLRITGCHGFCQMEPSILVTPARTFYPNVSPRDVERIVQAAAQGQVVASLLPVDPVTGQTVERQDDLRFFVNQVRGVLRGNEDVDPTRIEDYVAHDGYGALVRALSRGDPAWVVEQIKIAQLRGRGGGGFATGRKWEMFAKQTNAHGKFLVCNADEGDPGAYMDRSVLEGNPHAIIEGMLIAAFGTGATRGVIYVRSEYPLAIKHAQIALRQARGLGLLGENILGTGIRFDIDIVRGAGAFVCGEETALIKSIEGRMGEPRQRPPYPIAKGIFGAPTCINNVETLANVPFILRHGAEAFAALGVEGNTGTKIFSLVGKIRNTGLVEVPLGTPLKDVVYEIGGGPLGKTRVKAVQTGGPSGGCIPASQFDLPISYDSLAKVGSIMGSGGMIVMDENTCMVDVARYFMNFLKDESCGKCLTCRKGTQRMYEILEDITLGKGTPEHLDLLEELARVVKDTTMCGLGQSAPNPVLSTLRYFRDEYRRHIEDKRCDAFVCKSLVGAPCQAACPVDTEPWRYVALIEKGQYEEAYQIIRSANPFPAVSARVCDRKCEHRCSLGTSGGEAIAVRAMKRFVTDNVDPAAYHPAVRTGTNGQAKKVAVVGAGPAGLTAAHGLSLLGHKVTVLEAEQEPGGMLACSLPAYRLPRRIVRDEIQTLLNENIRLRHGVVLGKDVNLRELFAEGFQAVFLALGAHESWRLDLDGEDLEGVHPSMQFLKAFNLRGEELARGRVGIVGGGNSAVDAARVALRQKDVTGVTLLYRRTRDEMPAYEEEVEAALEEGVTIETLVSPVKIHVRQEEIEAALREGVALETLVSPVRIFAREGRVVGLRCVRNRLGELDASGRRKPVVVPGTEFTLPLDTLIVAIGERPQSDSLAAMGLEVDKAGRVRVDPKTLATSMTGVFAGGDLVTGPNTVIDAIAAGKKAVQVIDRYLRGEPLAVAARAKLPTALLEPAVVSEEELSSATRAVAPVLPVKGRKKNFNEVERSLSEEQARAEARRCLRCDLAFTRDGPAAAGAPQAARGEHQA
ncbi:MAG: FAD-dependent oxidoreductase [Planctomycetes bacterium]|jgi:NADH-quinone oxidoreductase subunit F|nr:FAD-dependent oxidoreductase [Planctomycetota bacterium]